jgi:hydroxymethylpyrimidine pyrophosphatase-like HAD family hydrolase
VPLDPHLIALDIDGTVLDYDGSLSRRVVHAVRAAVGEGHHIVIATGRGIGGVGQLIDDLGLTGGFVVCSNGAVTAEIVPSSAEGLHVVDTVTFDPGPAVRLLVEHLPDALFAVEVVPHGVRVTENWPDGELMSTVLDVAPLEELIAEPTTRVIVRSPRHTSEEFLAIAHRIGLHGVTYAVGYTAWLDLAPEGVSKASALEQVRHRLGVPPACTVAIGDGRNDIEMVCWAGRGLAMGNAGDELKQVADEVIPDVRADGVAQILEALVTSRPGHSSRP